MFVLHRFQTILAAEMLLPHSRKSRFSKRQASPRLSGGCTASWSTGWPLETGSGVSMRWLPLANIVMPPIGASMPSVLASNGLRQTIALRDGCADSLIVAGLTARSRP